MEKDDRDAQSHAIVERVRPCPRQARPGRGAASRWWRSRPARPSSTRWWRRSTVPPPRRPGEVAKIVRFLRVHPGGRGRPHSMEAARERVLGMDREKAGLKGIPAMAAVETLAGPGPARRGQHLRPAGASRCRCGCASRPRPARAAERRLQLRVPRRRAAGSRSATSSEESVPEPRRLVRKDLMPVVYVIADLAGEKESPVYAILALNEKLDAVPSTTRPASTASRPGPGEHRPRAP